MSENDNVFTFTIPLEVEIFDPEKQQEAIKNLLNEHPRMLLLSKENLEKFCYELFTKPKDSEEIEDFINRHI